MDRLFTRISTSIAMPADQPLTFILAAFVLFVWAITGPIFAFSDTWQLVVNTGTTMLTFLMVFLIQNTQNPDAAAIQAKLDDILRSIDKARSQFIGIEHLTDRQIERIRVALEREATQAGGKHRTGDHIVDRLLERS